MEPDFRELLNEISDGVLLLDAGEQVTYINAPACMILSCTRENAIGKKFSELCPLVHVLLDEEIRNPFRRVWSEGVAVNLLKHIGRKLPEGMQYLTIKCSPQLDAAGKTAGAMVLLQDITKQCLKGHFFANMTHEIRTPINGLNGMIELTLRTKLTEDQIENLVCAKSCAEDLLQLVNDILDFSKLDAGQMKLERLRFDVWELVDSICQMYRPLAEKKGLCLHEPACSRVPQFMLGDPLRVRQVFNNLLSNAVKFTERGAISIEVEQGNRNGIQTLEVKIHDTGIGMDEEAQKKLFHVFRQADDTVARRFGGTGLGLMIVRQLVENMGGEVHASSMLGKGSTFSFWIPLLLDWASAVEESARLKVALPNAKRMFLRVKQRERKEPIERKKTPEDDVSSLVAFYEKRLRGDEVNEDTDC